MIVNAVNVQAVVVEINSVISVMKRQMEKSSALIVPMNIPVTNVRNAVTGTLGIRL